MPRRPTASASASPSTSVAGSPGTRVVAIADDVRAGRWQDAEAACRALAHDQPKLKHWATGTADAAGRRDALQTVAQLVRLAAATDAMARAA